MIDLIFGVVFKIGELVISILMLITTVIISYFAIKISNGQLYVQSLQLKHSLYERRYEIYKKLMSKYHDYGDNLNLINKLQDQHLGIDNWLNENEDHIKFLFEESVLRKAHKLKEQLALAQPEFFKEDADKEVVQKIDELYFDLKSEISSVLSFRKLM